MIISVRFFLLGAPKFVQAHFNSVQLHSKYCTCIMYNVPVISYVPSVYFVFLVEAKEYIYWMEDD